MQKIGMLVVMVYLQPFCHNSLLKRVTTQNHEKFTKTAYFRCSKSSLLTPLWSSSPVLVMISSMSVPICNHFHAIQANSSKISTFQKRYISGPCLREIPSPRDTKFCHDKLESLWQPTVKIMWF